MHSHIQEVSQYVNAFPYTGRARVYGEAFPYTSGTTPYADAFPYTGGDRF